MKKTFAAILAVCYLCNFTIAHTEQTREKIEPPKKLTKAEKQQVECLAQNVYYEAGYETTRGQIAVAMVTLNRVYSGNYPKSICGTMTQKVEDTCQFSWYCDSALKKKPSDSEAYQESYDVAKKVLLEGFKLDKLSDALYYHATSINPGWHLPVVTQIGNHIFYRERKI